MLLGYVFDNFESFGTLNLSPLGLADSKSKSTRVLLLNFLGLEAVVVAFDEEIDSLELDIIGSGCLSPSENFFAFFLDSTTGILPNMIQFSMS